MSVKITYRTRLIQIATCLAFVMVLLDTSVVNVAVDSIRSTFHTDMLGIQWVINSYSIVFSTLLLTAGSLGDRYGSKPIFLAGFFLFTIGSILCGFSGTLGALIFSRVIQGLGAALLVPTSLSIIRTIFEDPTSRGKAVGWWGASGGIALAAGPVVGGLFISHFGWPSIFLLNVPLGIISFGIVLIYAPSKKTKNSEKLDNYGQLLSAFTLSLLTYGLIEASQSGWGSLAVIISFIGSALSALLLILVERSHSNPIIPLKLFRSSVLGVAIIIGLIANLTFYGIIFVLSLYFQLVKHFTPEEVGTAFLPMMSSLFLVNIIAGRLLPRVGPKFLTSLGLIISALGYLLLLLAIQSPHQWETSVAMLLSGSGIALAIPSITSATLHSTPVEKAGIASGLLNSARQVGGIIGVAIFGNLINVSTSTQFIGGVKIVLVVSCILLIYGAILSKLKLA
ncbi:MFS transporter [Rosenbergiella sp. S61]|uniref:MFS transporter n=1 Tax=Rosenbergiella gaditana TaxID=2726987 RepID=A0ABS5SXP8_9GAMM|nr:MFS transporter [Rosenbergiella gaditana]MBT0724880.1 MFS transporter [Rosenbergiella gaditana]